MKESDKHSRQVSPETDHLIDQFNDTKKSPYLFLILMSLPFVIYLLPLNYLEEKNLWITIVVILLVNAQADIYVLNKKLKILSKAINKG